jgi:hypothetical protein
VAEHVRGEVKPDLLLGLAFSGSIAAIFPTSGFS